MAHASISVTVTPSPPVLRSLQAPRRISAKARSLTLAIASLAPATLKVGRRHVPIDRTLRRIRILVRPGRKRLTLPLTLRSGRFTTVIPISVAR